MTGTDVWLYPYQPKGNPYTALFGAALSEAGCQVSEYRPRLRRQRDYPAVLHVHWPEQAASARNLLFAQVKARLFLSEVRRIQRAGGRIIWTAHNDAPHEQNRLRGNAFEKFIDVVDGVVHLSDVGRQRLEGNHPRLSTLPTVVAPIGDLTEGYGPLPDRISARQRLDIPPDHQVLCNFGRHRAYKGIDALVAAFRDESVGSNLTLVLAGYRGPQLEGRIKVLPEFLDDADLLCVIAAADLVVLPFNQILHSASVVLALGFGRPVLAPSFGSLPELQERVGDRWLQLYTGQLTSDLLLRAVDNRPGESAVPPKVSPMSWGQIADETLRLYRTVGALPDGQER